MTSKEFSFLTAINWRSFWNNIGLIGLVTTDITALGLVRAFIAQHPHEELEFNTIPKDSNDRRSIITVILKKDLRSFPAEKLAKVLILRNTGLEGNLTLASITHHGKTEKSRVGHSKEGWRTIEFVADSAFLQSLKTFPDDHLFTMGSLGLHIKGGVRKRLPFSRDRQPPQKPRPSDAFDVSASSLDSTSSPPDADRSTLSSHRGTTSRGSRPRPFQAWMQQSTPSQPPRRERAANVMNPPNHNSMDASSQQATNTTADRHRRQDKLSSHDSRRRSPSFRVPRTSRGGRSSESRKNRAAARNLSHSRDHSSRRHRNHSHAGSETSPRSPPTTSSVPSSRSSMTSTPAHPSTSSGPTRTTATSSPSFSKTKMTATQRKSMEELHKLIPDFDASDIAAVNKKREERVRDGSGGGGT